MNRFARVMLKLIVHSLCLAAACLTMACSSGDNGGPKGADTTGNGGLSANGGGVATSGGATTMGMGGLVNGAGMPGFGGIVGGGGMLGNGGMITMSAGGTTNGGATAAGGSTMTAGGTMNAGGMLAMGGTMNAGGMAGAGTGGAMMVGPYPMGPYGSTMGATLTNLQLSGYVNDSGTGISNDAGKMNWKDAYSLQDVRATGAKYALIHVSEFF